MTRIAAQVFIAAGVSDVYAKVATSKGLSQWFAEAYFKVNQQFGSVRLRVWDEVDLVVTELASPVTIVWHCTTAGHAWFKSDVRFTFREEQGGTVLNFVHDSWADEDAAFSEWRDKWPELLQGLKSVLEA